jgi:Predicted permease, DMT superfamily
LPEWFQFRRAPRFAKTLFPVVGSEGVAALRLGISSLVLLAVFRPWTLRNSGISWGAMSLYGIVLALMNLLIYRAFAYIPISIAISIEVMGPLIAALLTSRQKTDLLWILLSASGLFLLAAGDIHKVIDIRGVAYSLAAAFFLGTLCHCGQKRVERRRALCRGRHVHRGPDRCSARNGSGRERAGFTRRASYRSLRGHSVKHAAISAGYVRHALAALPRIRGFA